MRLLIVLFVCFGFVSSCAVLLHKTTPLECYDQAKHYEAEGDYAKSVNCLTKAIKDMPAYYDAYLYRAELQTKRDSTDRAIEDYTALLTNFALNGDQKGELLFKRGNVYYSALKDSLACVDWDASCEQYGFPSACKEKRMKCNKKK